MKATIGFASVLAGLLLHFTAMADQSPPSYNNPTPSATGAPRPAPSGMPKMKQHRDIRNDAQNYRRAENQGSRHWKEHKVHRHHKMEERRKHHPVAIPNGAAGAVSPAPNLPAPVSGNH